jgi:hypothetical protein
MDYSQKDIEKAESSVDKIIDDLSGRCGVGDEWDNIDDDIKEEIRSCWVGLILNG